MRRAALLSLFAIGATVAIVEIGLRLSGFGYPLLYRASASGYEPAPSQTVVRLGKSTHINALGTRGADSSPHADLGTQRILVLGDSVAFGGTQINDSETFPALLELYLGRAGQTIEVLNASAGGWAPENELNWLRQHGLLDASFLVWVVNEKDLEQPFVEGSFLDNNPAFPTANPPLAIGELLFRYVLPRLGLGVSGADPGSTIEAPPWRPGRDVIEVAGDLQTFAMSRSSELLIFYWDANYGPVPMPTVAIREKLLAFAAENDIMLIRPQLNIRPDGARLYRDGIHPNELGNREVAQQLATVLRSKLGR